MLYLYTRLQTLLSDTERGATAVEYGLMVALIAAVIVGTVVLLGNALNLKFSDVVTSIG